MAEKYPPYSDDIIGVIVNGNLVTNDRAIIQQALESDAYVEFLDRKRCAFMASCDLGRVWTNLSSAPTIFYWDAEKKEPRKGKAENG